MAIESQQKVASVGSSIRQLSLKTQNELLVREESQLESQVALLSSSSLQIQRQSQLEKGSEKGKNKEIIVEGAASSTTSSPYRRSSRSPSSPRRSRTGSKRARSPTPASASSPIALDARAIDDDGASHVPPKKKRRRVVPYVLVPALEQVDAFRPAHRVPRGNGNDNVNGSQDRDRNRDRSEYESVKSSTPDELLLGEGEDEVAVGIDADADADVDVGVDAEGESELEEHDTEPEPEPDSVSVSESEVGDSGAVKGPVQHVFVQAPPIHTSPLYLSRERSILRRALLPGTERACLGIGRYNPSSHWDEFAPRAHVDVIKKRGVHATRNESRAERYVRILEDAYGKGDWWRGEGRKPSLVVGSAGRSQAQVKETVIIESSSEDESKAESEDGIGEFTRMVDTHVQTRENELSDSSADPPAPITPPDEVPLLRDSITVVNSIAKAAGNADALSAPIVVYE
ncbi:hypothetical protein ACEPAF_9437 [Sanghuangporus sanghuang]